MLGPLPRETPSLRLPTPTPTPLRLQDHGEAPVLPGSHVPICTRKTLHWVSPKALRILVP